MSESTNLVLGDIMAEYDREFWASLRALEPAGGAPTVTRLGRANRGRTLRPVFTGIPPVKAIPCTTNQEA